MATKANAKVLGNLITIPERNYPVGSNSSGNLKLPDGIDTLDVTMTQPNWPTVSDGQITLRLLVSRNQGPFVVEWQDNFEHQQLLRHGVPVDTIDFGCSLQAPLTAADRLRAEYNSTVAFRTALTVNAG